MGVYKKALKPASRYKIPPTVGSGKKTYQDIPSKLLQIDRSDPFGARCLIFVYAVPGGLWEAVNQILLPSDLAYRRNPNTGEPELYHPGGTAETIALPANIYEAIYVNNGGGADAGRYTVGARVCKHTQTSGTFYAVSLEDDGSGTNGSFFDISATGLYSYQIRSSVFNVFSPNVPGLGYPVSALTSFSCNGGNSPDFSGFAWTNGEIVSYTATEKTGYVRPADWLTQIQINQSGNTDTGSMGYAFMLKERTDVGEAPQLNVNPFRMLKPRNLRLYFTAAANQASITANQAETGDQAAASLEIPRNLTASIAEAGDTAAANIERLAQITASQAETGDSQAASIVASASITANQAETGDSQAASIVASASITANQAETGDQAAASLEIPRNLTASIAEAGDTTAANIGLLAQITVSQAETGDTQAASVQASIGARNVTANQAETGDTQAATIERLAQITAAHAEAGDVAVVNLAVLAQITASQAETGDTQAATVNVFDFAATGAIHTVLSDPRTVVILSDSRTITIRPRPNT